MKVADRYAVLIVDASDCPLGEMALSLTRVGLDPVYTNNADEALLLAQQEGKRIGAVCFPADLEVEGIDRLAKQVGDRIGLTGDCMIPVGKRPSDEVVTALRERGIRWSLWGPYEDSALRFVFTNVIGAHCYDDVRLEPRVPAGMLEVNLYKGAVARPARLVDLSVTGAFLETDRPLPENSAVSLELCLPEKTLRLRARVCWTRRDPDAERSDVSVGMGVEFVGHDPEHEAELRRFVRAQLARFVVSVGGPADGSTI